jgi:hypothetical protein
MVDDLKDAALAHGPAPLLQVAPTVESRFAAIIGERTEATDDKSKQPKSAEAKPEKEKADDENRALLTSKAQYQQNMVEQAISMGANMVQTCNRINMAPINNMRG